MPNSTSAGIINANIGNANLQGQISVQVGHGIVMDKIHGLDSQRQQNEIDRLTELARPRPMPLPSSGDSPEALIAGQTVVIGGVFPSPFIAHNIVILVNGKGYVYAVQPTDTLATTATALAALVAANWPGTVATAGVITFPGAANITAARVGVTGTSVREIRRQERVFQITVWASTPGQRDTIGAALDVSLAATEFLTMPDGYGARLIYRSSNVVDDLQKAKLYRRDFQYSLEYATTQTETDTQITQEQLGIALSNDGATQFVAARITNF